MNMDGWTAFAFTITHIDQIELLSLNLFLGCFSSVSLVCSE